MHHIGLPEMLVILVVMILMFSGQGVHETARKLAEAISKFKGGGPGSPSHPIPADDSRILTRKPKRPEQRQS